MQDKTSPDKSRHVEPYTNANRLSNSDANLRRNFFEIFALLTVTVVVAVVVVLLMLLLLFLAVLVSAVGTFTLNGNDHNNFCANLLHYVGKCNSILAANWVGTGAHLKVPPVGY